jgi:hypothetical protein
MSIISIYYFFVSMNINYNQKDIRMDDNKLNIIKDAIKTVVEAEVGVDVLYPILFTTKFGIDRKVAALAYTMRVDKEELVSILPKRAEGEGVNARASIAVLVELIRKARGFEPKPAKVKTDKPTEEKPVTHKCDCGACMCDKDHKSLGGDDDSIEEGIPLTADNASLPEEKEAELIAE